MYVCMYIQEICVLHLCTVCVLFAHSGYRSRIESKDTRLFCLRVMVGVIILYDHVDPIGAFQKKSTIDVSIQYIVTLF